MKLLPFVPFVLFASLVSCAATAAAPGSVSMPQEQSKPARTKGTILKGDVDKLVDAIATQTNKAGSAAPYAATIDGAARMLCAMGHCHRFYVAIDNPRIRATLGMLIAGRRDDGSFGATASEDAMTTAWVVDALTVMDADRYRDEIATARKWLAGQGIEGSPWAGSVAEVMARLRADVFPEHVAKDDVAAAAKLRESAPLDAQAAIALLVRLVACQQCNRDLDRAEASPQGIATFSPEQSKAFDYLMTQQQDGTMLVSFGEQKQADPAITAIALLAMLTKPATLRTQAESAAIDKGMQWLLSCQNEDGSFGKQLQNYTTSVAVGALLRWGMPPAKSAVDKAQRYILACQNAEQGGYERGDRDYGSIGYGGSQRGDLSNVNFALQALRESGLPAEHEAFQKALVFLQRSQNLKSVNDFTGKVSDPDAGGKIMDIESGNDGGSGYYPGNSAAGYDETPDGKSHPRSYGSMTYALLKSYTLCGLPADDPRVQGAVRWISQNWTLDENPGFTAPLGDKARQAGLFYYFMVLSQALDLAKVEVVQTSKPEPGAKPDALPAPIEWRKALRQKLLSLQQKDGSFVNEKNARWMESMHVLCTCYALIALERCR
jgi:Squalene-hopene cyclase C-terminal domain/Prenyltransferase and squalene oxidase repeat